MRLKNVERGDGLLARGMIAFIRVVSRHRTPDVIRTLLFHRKMFGAWHGEHTQAVMRGPSEWSVGQRELFAAFVSRLNQCLF
jgi:hypothetical protein